MISKSSMIRDMLTAGKSVKDICHALNVPVNRVHTEKWKMKTAKLRNRKIKATSAHKPKRRPGRPKKVKAFTLDDTSKLDPSTTKLSDFVLWEMTNIEHQIDRLQVIRSFLSIRLEQLKQNGE